MFFFFFHAVIIGERRSAAQRRGDGPVKKQKTKARVCGLLAKCGNRIVPDGGDDGGDEDKGLAVLAARHGLRFGSHQRKSIATVAPACFTQTGIHFCPLELSGRMISPESVSFWWGWC